MIFFSFHVEKAKKEEKENLAKLMYESLRILEDILPHDVSDT